MLKRLRNINDRSSGCSFNTSNTSELEHLATLHFLTPVTGTGRPTSTCIEYTKYLVAILIMSLFDHARRWIRSSVNQSNIWKGLLFGVPYLDSL